MKKIFAFIAILASVTGCASTPDIGNVIPMEGGIYQGEGQGSSSESAMKSALYTAEATCKAQGKRHVVVSQKAQYKGVVSQETNRAIDGAAQALANITGKWTPSLSNDDDHQISLTFKCES
jgi:hypothetical protein